MDLCVTERSRKYGLGWIEQDLMQRTIDITFANSKRPVKVADVFTNAYSSKVMPAKQAIRLLSAVNTRKCVGGERIQSRQQLRDERSQVLELVLLPQPAQRPRPATYSGSAGTSSCCRP